MSTAPIKNVGLSLDAQLSLRDRQDADLRALDVGEPASTPSYEQGTDTGELLLSTQVWAPDNPEHQLPRIDMSTLPGTPADGADFVLYWI